MSACRQLLIGTSISRYLPPIGTAGFERVAVSGNSRDPWPPPRMMASVSVRMPPHSQASGPKAQNLRSQEPWEEPHLSRVVSQLVVGALQACGNVDDCVISVLEVWRSSLRIRAPQAKFFLIIVSNEASSTTTSWQVE